MKDDIKKHIKEYYAYWLGLNNLYDEWAKSYNMSVHSLFALYAIWENQENCTQKIICDEWLMPKQTINSVLKNFKDKGYIELLVNENDRRNKIIHLTSIGKIYAQDVLQDLLKLEESVMQKMGQTNRESMTKNNALFLELFKKEMETKK
ncbi:MarR family winged helix-turn-helix transcriptional regulator [Clostridioides difficile]|uniref:MarR family winged helix-turn-helix transcriptional regulator n=1 Tax=Clostridioides difficile TaxID=1496 RepID=UPI003F8D5E20